jgi:hypothetical protein
MKFEDVTYTGPTFNDAELLNELPPDLAAALLEENGFIAVRGGFHLRGVCHEPAWHSLRAAWLGPERVASRYPTVRPTDIPFAEDAVGDQFLWRGGVVHRLSGETGEVESLGVTLGEFLERAATDPLEYLSLGPLVGFEKSGRRLEPGQLLNVYPPYCFDTPADRSFKAVPAEQQLRFLAHLAEELRDLPDGTQVQLKVVP